MDGALAADRKAEVTPLKVGMRPEQIDAIAIVCHEANRAYRIVIGEDAGRDWAGLPELQRDFTRDRVRRAIEHPDERTTFGADVQLDQLRKYGLFRAIVSALTSVD